MSDESERITQLLCATLSAENATRNMAEQELLQLAKNPGLAEILLKLLASSSQGETRMAAALAFKNFVRVNWSGDGDAPLDEMERQRIRQVVLELLFQVPSTYRRQLSLAACFIGKKDFPHAWPELMVVIRDAIVQSQDFDRLTAALSTLDELVKRYRHELRSNDLFSEILLVVGAVAEPLTNLYSRLLEYLPQEGVPDTMPMEQRKAWLELIFLIIHCYHSLISQDLPEFFEDNMTGWMGGFAVLLKTNFPSIDAQSLDTEPNVVDKIKTAICQIVTLYSQRYEDCFQNFVTMFISNIWELLVVADNRTRFDALVNSALGFLSAICQRNQYTSYFLGEGVLSRICENIIVKNLSLRDEDLEMYECEPFEFLKRDIEGSDLETRRRGASDFVKALCKFFESTVFEILSGIIRSFLVDYESNPIGNFVKKDAVFYLVSAIATKSTTERYGVTNTSQLINISDFYQQYVREDLLVAELNALPIIKCDALKYLVQFRHQLQPELVLESLAGVDHDVQRSIVRFFGSTHVILHHYVAYAIERLLLVKNTYGQPLFTSDNLNVKHIIDALFVCFNSEHAYMTPYLMKALMRCFTIMDDTTAQSAHTYVKHLEMIISRAIQNPINPNVAHFVFEAICVLIRKAYTKVEGGLDAHVLRIVELIIPRDIVDFVPYALQLTALLLDQSKVEREAGRVVAQDQFLSFFPTLLGADFWTRPANVPALILVLESYVSSFPQIVLGSEYVSQMVGIYQRLVQLKSQDHHGLRLGAAFLPFVDAPEYPKLTTRELFLPLLNRMHTQKTTKFAKLFVLFFFRYVVIKNAVALVSSLESIQPNMFYMIVEKIILPEMKGMPHTTTYEEKRIVAVGFSRLVSDAADHLGQLYPELVSAAIGILEAFEHRHGSRGDQLDELYVDTNELEYSDPYCKLSYAQHVDTLGKDVGDVRKILVEAVLVRNSHRIESLSSNARNILNTYAAFGN